MSVNVRKVYLWGQREGREWKALNMKDWSQGFLMTYHVRVVGKSVEKCPTGRGYKGGQGTEGTLY